MMRALCRIAYDGSIIVECTAAGPDRFTPTRDTGWLEEGRGFSIEPLHLLKAYASLL